MSGLAPFRTSQDAVAMLAALLPLVGVGSKFDTDLVRGRAFPTDSLRFDPAPAFTPPPLYGDPTMAAYLTGA